MKKFLDDVFKPYLFPILLAFLTVYFREALDFKPITEFFGNSSSRFVNFFNAQLYLWQIVLYGCIIYLIVRIFSKIFKTQDKEERKMLRAISKDPREFGAEFSGNKKFLAKYKLSVLHQEYIFDKFALYCNNCSEESQKMTRYGNDSFVCSLCGTDVNYTAYRNIKTAIINRVEKFE